MKRIILIILTGLILINAQEKSIKTLNEAAELYVKLVLELGLYDADFVDAYYGPAEWKPDEKTKLEKLPYEKLISEYQKINEALLAFEKENKDAETGRRIEFLIRQLNAVKGRIELVNGKKYKFDEETKIMYDAVSPEYSTEYYDEKVKALEKLLPGSGTLQERFEKYRERFVIPDNIVNEVFEKAVAIARKKTLEFVKFLPDHESFKIEFVTNKPWGAYNWYKGNSFSVIQFNKDIKSYIDRPLELACHEGYPGHHVYNGLLENRLYKEKGWVEFCVYPLFSPQSLIAEGTANYGISLLFSHEERIKTEFELFKSLGLTLQEIENYHNVLGLIGELDFAGNTAAKKYLEGEFNDEQAVDYMVKYLLMTKERAAKRLDFVKKYRSYIINYNVGTIIIDKYISSSEKGNTPEGRWELFIDILSNPVTPSMLSR